MTIGKDPLPNIRRGYIQALCQLKTMEIGEVITKEHMQAIRYFFGNVLDNLKPLVARTQEKDEKSLPD